MVKIIQNRNRFFIFSGILIIASILSLSVWGFDLGIDFKGGSLLEVQTQGEHQMTAPDASAVIKSALPEIGEVRVQPTEDGFMIRMKDLSEQEHQEVLNILNSEINNFKIETGEVAEEEGNKIILEDAEGLEVESIELVSEGETVRVIEKRFESIGPVIGQELKSKAIWAIGLALIIIIAFIAFAFRQVSKPVASWKYGIGAIIALAHDIIIVVGIFAALNHFFLGFEVDILFVTALLTILGYSVNDTIVVYDRTRENLIYSPQSTFEETVNKSVNDTITRSINTSLTTLLVLLSLYFLGGATIQNFVLALIVGTLIGAYSSIFIASPLLVVWQKMSKK